MPFERWVVTLMTAITSDFVDLSDAKGYSVLPLATRELSGSYVGLISAWPSDYIGH